VLENFHGGLSATCDATSTEGALESFRGGLSAMCDVNSTNDALENFRGGLSVMCDATSTEGALENFRGGLSAMCDEHLWEMCGGSLTLSCESMPSLFRSALRLLLKSTMRKSPNRLRSHWLMLKWFRMKRWK